LNESSGSRCPVLDRECLLLALSRRKFERTMSAFAAAIEGKADIALRDADVS